MKLNFCCKDQSPTLGQARTSIKDREKASKVSAIPTLEMEKLSNILPQIRQIINYWNSKLGTISDAAIFEALKKLAGTKCT